MNIKIFIPLFGEEVAPRFDLATEVLLAECAEDGTISSERLLMLPNPSAERLCHMILSESVDTVICGGIEQEFYDYLTWKQVKVVDNIIGASRSAIERFAKGRLEPGDILERRR